MARKPPQVRPPAATPRADAPAAAPGGNAADAEADTEAETDAPDDGAPDDEAVLCPVFDPQSGRPCGQPAEPESLTCRAHRARPTRTQISRNDAARRRYG